MTRASESELKSISGVDKRPASFYRREREMTPIRYDIVNLRGGWCITCGGVIGPPYFRRREAIEDVLFVAKQLEKSGEQVIVTLEGAKLPITTH